MRTYCSLDAMKNVVIDPNGNYYKTGIGGRVIYLKPNNWRYVNYFSSFLLKVGRKKGRWEIEFPLITLKWMLCPFSWTDVEVVFRVGNASSSTHTEKGHVVNYIDLYIKTHGSFGWSTSSRAWSFLSIISYALHFSSFSTFF